MPTPCTRCGAPLPETAAVRVCGACGQVHDATVGARPGSTFGAGRGPRPAPTPMPPGAASWGARRREVGCVVLFAVAAPIIIAVVGVFLALQGDSGAGDDDGAGTELSPSTGDLLVLPGDLADDPRVVTMATPIGGDGRVIALVDLEDGPVWEAEIVPDDVYSAQMVATDDVVVASLGREVVGLDRGSGAVLWEAEASDTVDPFCPACFALVDGALVVLGGDGEVTAFDPGTGDLLWSHRFVSAIGQVVPLGDAVLLVDDRPPEATDAALTLTLVRPADGTEIHRFTPGCVDASTVPGGFSVPARPDLPVIPVPDSDDVVLVYGSHPSCIQRWNVTTGEERWSAVTDDASLDWYGVDEQPWGMSRSELVVAGLDSWVVVGLAEGGIRAVPAPPDSRVEPSVHVVGGVFVGAVTSTRGTPELALVAHDLRSGEEAWTRTVGPEVNLAVVGPQSSSETVWEDPLVAVVPWGEELRLLAIGPPGRRFALSEIDLATGEGDIVGVAPIRTDSTTSLSVRIDTVRDGQALVDVDGVFHVVDLTTGAVGATWGR